MLQRTNRGFPRFQPENEDTTMYQQQFNEQFTVATRQFEDDLALAAAFLSGAGTPAAPR